jgi:hypothetical protein
LKGNQDFLSASLDPWPAGKLLWVHAGEYNNPLSTTQKGGNQ